MTRVLRNDTTPEARDIWAAIDRAAARVPEWLHEKLRREAALRMVVPPEMVE